MGAGRERCELVVKAVWVVHILPYFCLPPCSKGILGTGMVDTRRAAVGGNGSNNADQDCVGRGCGGSSFGSRDLGCASLR